MRVNYLIKSYIQDSVYTLFQVQRQHTKWNLTFPLLLIFSKIYMQKLVSKVFRDKLQVFIKLAQLQLRCCCYFTCI